MKNCNGDGGPNPEPTHRRKRFTHRNQQEGWAGGEGRGSPLRQAAGWAEFCARLRNLPTLQGWFPISLLSSETVPDLPRSDML